jgi:hypothetical protein
MDRKLGGACGCVFLSRLATCTTFHFDVKLEEQPSADVVLLDSRNLAQLALKADILYSLLNTI